MFISKEAINEQETQIAVDLDNITILPTTETIVVRVIEKYLDSEDKVLRTKSTGQIIFRNIDSSTACFSSWLDTGFSKNSGNF